MPLSHEEIGALFHRLWRGDETVVEALVAAQSRELRVIIARRLEALDDAAFDPEDVEQMAWASFFRRLDASELRNPACFRACLLAIAEHKALQVVRDQTRQVRDHGRDTPLRGSPAERMPAARPGPDREAEGRDEWQAILAALPPQQREILVTRSQCDDNLEVAARLEISVSTVARAIRAAAEVRQRLRCG